MTSRRMKCTECGWVGDIDELLLDVNPFNRKESIIGCPECKATSCVIEACEVDGCNKLGTYSYAENGEEHKTCGEHYRWQNTQRT